MKGREREKPHGYRELVCCIMTPTGRKIDIFSLQIERRIYEIVLLLTNGIADYSPIPLIMLNSIYTCREPRQSPTYEAYSRSRRYSTVSPFLSEWCLYIYPFPILLILLGKELLLSFFLSISVCRSRSRSRSYSPSHSRRYSRSSHADDIHRSKPRTPKIEYITEFGSSGAADEPRLEGFSPPRSPTSQVDMLNRSEHWTFNSCQDRLDSLFSAQHISHIVVWGNFLWFRIDQD